MHSPAQYTKSHSSKKAINIAPPPFPSSRIQHNFQTTTYPFHQSQYKHSIKHNTSLISSIIVFRKRQLRSHTFPTDEYPNSWDSWVLRQMTRNTTDHSFHLLKGKTIHQPKSPPFLDSHSFSLATHPFESPPIFMNNPSIENYIIKEKIGEGCRVMQSHKT